MRWLSTHFREESGEVKWAQFGFRGQRSKRVIFLQPSCHRHTSCSDFSCVGGRARQSKCPLPSVWSQHSRAVKGGTFYIQMTSRMQCLGDPPEREVGRDTGRHLWRKGVSRKFSESILYDLRGKRNR